MHFGNGISAIFADDPRVLMCSIYQHPIYPGINPPTRPGREINCPLPPGSNGQDARRAVREHRLPELHAFKPQIVCISAGFDAAPRDPLGDPDLHPDDFAQITGELVQLASAHAQGRIVSVLEGGYDLDALAGSTLAHVAALQTRPWEDQTP